MEANINVKRIMDNWDLQNSPDREDIESAMIEAFNFGASLSSRDSKVRNEAEDYLAELYKFENSNGT